MERKAFQCSFAILLCSVMISGMLPFAALAEEAPAKSSPPCEHDAYVLTCEDAPSCTEHGRQVYTCAECQASYEVEPEPTGHTARSPSTAARSSPRRS